MSGPVTAADRRACRALLREGSRSFHAASRLLPAGARDDAAAVYAWCRAGDHAVDRSDRPATALEAIRAGLARVYEEGPEGSVERAFAAAATRNGIPRSVPEAMLEGFEWDVAGRRYETRAELVDYCVRVGSTVGVMMTLVMGARETEALTAACRLGVAMQLTNIARDVGEDARAGRLYLPGAVLRERGIDPDAWLVAPVAVEGIRSAVRLTLDDADRLYAAAWPGIGNLPSRCRAGIRAAALVYAEIGRKVRETDCDSVTRRAWTGRLEKAWLLGRALGGRPGAWVRSTSRDADSRCVERADERAAFLVHAVAGG